jgi:integrase
MAKATKLPSGNWRVRAKVTVAGQSLLRSFSAPTAKEAERMADEWQSHTKMIGKDYTLMTVKEAMQLYIDTKGEILSPSTIAGYNVIINNGMPLIINTKLCHLDSLLIQRSINNDLQKLTTKTIKNRYGFLRTILGTFYPDFIWSVDYGKSKKKVKRAYSTDYIKQICNAVKGTDFEVETYLGLLSLRASEIGGLMWKDIDFENKCLNVCRAKLQDKDKNWVINDDTKTYDSARTVYMPNYVCELLRKRAQESVSEYVSTKNPCNYWKDLNRKLEKHNVERIGFHQLRHIYSSVSASLGIDNEIRKQNGGWSNEKIMDGTYRHPMTEAQNQANKKMNAFVNTVAQGDTKSDTIFKKRLKIKRYGI